MKQCCTCRKDKEESEFHSYSNRCKQCFSKKSVEWRNKNKKRANDLCRVSWHKYRDKNLIRAKEWRLNNKEKVLQTCANRRAMKKTNFIESVSLYILLEMDDGVCQLCGKDVNPLDYKSYEIDHIIPLSRGGEHSYANTQLAHKRCNASKGNRLLEGTY